LRFEKRFNLKMDLFKGELSLRAIFSVKRFLGGPVGDSFIKVLFTFRFYWYVISQWKQTTTEWWDDGAVTW